MNKIQFLYEVTQFYRHFLSYTFERRTQGRERVCVCLCVFRGEAVVSERQWYDDRRKNFQHAKKKEKHFLILFIYLFLQKWLEDK